MCHYKIWLRNSYGNLSVHTIEARSFGDALTAACCAALAALRDEYPTLNVWHQCEQWGWSESGEFTGEIDPLMCEFI